MYQHLKHIHLIFLNSVGTCSSSNGNCKHKDFMINMDTVSYSKHNTYH